MDIEVDLNFAGMDFNSKRMIGSELGACKVR